MRSSFISSTCQLMFGKSFFRPINGKMSAYFDINACPALAKIFSCCIAAGTCDPQEQKLEGCRGSAMARARQGRARQGALEARSQGGRRSRARQRDAPTRVQQG